MQQQLAHAAPLQHRLGDPGGLRPVLTGIDKNFQLLRLHGSHIDRPTAILSSGY
jgi:hypothetical protein